MNDREAPPPLGNPVGDPLPLELQVVSFLRQHPGFLNEHPSLLAELSVPHAAGGAVSLIERQVMVLREQQRYLDQGYRELIQIARDNEDLKGRLHRLTLRLLGAQDLEAVLAALAAGLADEGRAELCGLLVFARPALEPARPLPAFAGEDGPERAVFEDLCTARQPVCGSLEPSRAEALFGRAAEEIRSAALVPLGCRHWTGVLGAASRDPNRYRVGLGVEFLAQLGELTSALLDPYIADPGAPR